MTNKTQTVISLNSATNGNDQMVLLGKDANVSTFNVEDYTALVNTLSGEELEKAEHNGKVILSKIGEDVKFEQRLDNIRGYAKDIYESTELDDNQKEKGLYLLLRAMFSVNKGCQFASSIALSHKNLVRIIKHDMDNYDVLQIRSAKDNSKHLFYDIRCWGTMIKSCKKRGKIKAPFSRAVAQRNM